MKDLDYQHTTSSYTRETVELQTKILRYLTSKLTQIGLSGLVEDLQSQYLTKRMCHRLDQLVIAFQLLRETWGVEVQQRSHRSIWTGKEGKQTNVNAITRASNIITNSCLTAEEELQCNTTWPADKFSMNWIFFMTYWSSLQLSWLYSPDGWTKAGRLWTTRHALRNALLIPRRHCTFAHTHFCIASSISKESVHRFWQAVLPHFRVHLLKVWIWTKSIVK